MAERHYSTRQQQAILSCVREQGGCFTAATLTERLRARGERVGTATLYRQLEKLERQGTLQRIVTDEGACWQCCEERDCDGFLLKCEHCGRIEPVDCTHLHPLYEHLRREHGFSINPRRTMLYGLCRACGEGD